MIGGKILQCGWKKDLEHVLRVYYKYNTASFKEAEWVRLKEKFFKHFLPHKEEALGLKERCPIDYMAYIEDHFYKATGLHLNGLRSFTAWIKQGSYYHGLVARQGRLHECPHLVGVPLPRWPQVTPSESCRELQMKSDAQTTSCSKPSVGAMVDPVTETPVVETPVVEAPVTETPGAEAPAAPLTHLLPWRQVEQVMASHGPNASRLAQTKGFRGLGPRSTPGPNQGGMSQDPHFPSPSKTVRGGLPPFHSSKSPTWLVVG